MAVTAMRSVAAAMRPRALRRARGITVEAMRLNTPLKDGRSLAPDFTNPVSAVHKGTCSELRPFHAHMR